MGATFPLGKAARKEPSLPRQYEKCFSVSAAAASLLHQAPASGPGTARRLGWALRPRALALLLAGSITVLPGFFLRVRAGRLAVFPLLWDFAVLLLAAIELRGLPRAFVVSRRFVSTPALGQPTRVELTIKHEGSGAITVQIEDALHPSLAPLPLRAEVRAFPREQTSAEVIAVPRERGDYELGPVFCRVRGRLGLAERWITAVLHQQVRVYPGAVRGEAGGELPLLNAKRLELERRRLRHRGAGREFESLREYQAGDALRDVSWTATARRGRMIARQYTTERSQQVWVLLDAGRLSQGTARVLPGSAPGGLPGGGSGDGAMPVEAIPISQLDEAANTAILLARAVGGAGDLCGLLAYGRTVRQQLLPGAGAGHMRLLVDQLAQVRSERGEPNHLRAAARLKTLQRRRGLVIWITEVAESAGRPEIAAAVAELGRRHLTVVLLLEQPGLRALANAEADEVEAMFASGAAREMEERRARLVAELERGGALVVRTTGAQLAGDAIRKYLEVKERALL